MSTKTTFKRIALVTVAALGFGVLSVAPSSAAAGAATFSVAVLNTTNTGASTAPIAAGTNISAELRIDNGSDTVAGETITATYEVLNPNGDAITSLCTFSETTTAAFQDDNNSTLVGSKFTITVETATVGGLDAATSGAFGNVICPTTIGGIYKITPKAISVKASGFTSAATQAATDINVSGIAVTQGTLKGVKAGEAVTGNQAKVKVFFPTHTGSETYKVVPSGVGSIIGKTDVTGSSATISGTADASAGYLYTNAASTALATMELSLSSAVAGVQTITVQAIDAGTGVASALYSATVTWGAAPTYKSATAFINTTLGSESVANVTTKSSSGTYNSVAVARIDVRQYSTADTTTAVVTGSGNVKTVAVTTSVAGAVDSAADGLARSGSATVATSATANGIDEFYLFADGRTGDATVTVTVDGVSVASWTWTFLGAAKTLKEDAVNSPTKTYIGVGETGTVSVLAYDANSKLATLPAGLIVSSDTATTASAVASTNGSATVTGNAAGKTMINFCVAACATSLNKVAIAVQVTKTTAKTGSVKMAFDKATYAPGEKMTLTVTALDVDGNPVADGARALFGATGVTANVSLTGLPATSVDLAAGSATYTLYAPFASGEVALTGSEGTAVGALERAAAAVAGTTYVAPKVLASATVVNPATDAATAAAELAEAAAQDATDAALDATEAATLAGALAQEAVDAVADLSAQVATLISALKKQITTLTNLVIKIQKKVKA